VRLAGKQIDFVFRVTHAKSDREFARVKTGCIAYHLEKRWAVEVPEGLKRKLLAANSASPQRDDNT
jgi:hypothetical protein